MSETKKMKKKVSIAKPQTDRFVEAAKELGCDESGEAFERAFGKIVPPKHPKKIAENVGATRKPDRAHKKDENET